MKHYPRLIALGPIMLGEAYHPVNNPLIFNLDYPGHPSHGSSIGVEAFKAIRFGPTHDDLHFYLSQGRAI